MSRCSDFLSRVLLAVVAIAAIAADARASSPSIRLVGVTPEGKHVTITWSEPISDVSIRDESGAESRLSFDQQRAVRQSISGDVFPLVHGSLQLLRRALTSDFEGMRVTYNWKTSDGSSTSYSLSRNGLVSVLRDREGLITRVEIAGIVLANLRYRGRIAVAWTSSNDILPSFTATSGPAAPNTPTRMPVSPWAQEARVGPIQATVAGRRAKVLVDTSRPGISVSKAFLQKVDGAPPSVVRLDDVVVAGRHAQTVFARTDEDPRYDLYVGLEVFPRSSVAISRSGAGRIEHVGCRAGATLLPFEGTGRVFGLNGSQYALIDTRHIGAPEIHMYLTPALDPIPRCEPRPRTIVFAGKIYGRDRFCNVSPGLHPNLRPSNDVHLGLESLQAKGVVFDMIHDRLCVQ